MEKVKTMATAKARLHQFYAKMEKRCKYETFQQPRTAAMVAPKELFGLVKEDTMFVCKLHLPDGGTIQSSGFRRKKDAEQHAALLALQTLKILWEPSASSTTEEKWEGLLHKVSLAFTDQMMLSYKPMAEHFRAAVRSEGSRVGQVPAIVLTILDNKISAQCKSINQLAENNPAHAAALVCRAAAACPTLRLSADGLWIGRSGPLPAELVTKLLSHRGESTISEPSQNRSELEIPQLTSLNSNAACHFKAVRIPACAEKEVTAIALSAASGSYHLNVIAHELGVPNAGHVFLTRQITKAPHGTHMFWPLKKSLPTVSVPGGEQVEHFMNYLDSIPKDGTMEILRHPGGLITENPRASFLVGHAIEGDAIIATVGSTWQSEGKCIYDDFTLSYFYRLMLGRTPRGAYKLSRESILVADLPKVYTCRAQWQGGNPKNLLADFCHQHHLPEAQFTCTSPQDSVIDNFGFPSIVGECDVHSISMNDETTLKDQHCTGKRGLFHSKVLVGSAGVEGTTQFESDGFFRTRNDAIQSAALKALLYYDRWCATSCLPTFFQKQACCKSSYPLSFIEDNRTARKYPVASGEVLSRDCTSYGSEGSNGAFEGIMPIFEVIDEDPVLGDCPPPGSMVSVSYSVSLIEEATSCNTNKYLDNTLKHILEAQAEFKFELSVGAVIAPFDACVTQALVGQTLRFHMPAESLGILLSASNSSGQPQQGRVVEYTVKLLKHAEAPEERIESSHFSPPLSKQRMEYARTIINALEAKSLVDLGCGSGSLLEALLEEPNTLEYIVGVDTSRKALIRAAKTLNTSLTRETPGHRNPCSNLQKLSLYEGTISDMDPGLQHPDFATCIEVVEHMDAEFLDKLGESVLGQLVPRVLMVSTPNIEYNPIIRGLEWDSGSSSLGNTVSPDGTKEIAGTKKLLEGDPSMLRNHDHRFEWTRAEFRDWASHLAAWYGYQVCFGGVGGDDSNDDDCGPGFATQIAIFVHNSVVLLPTCPPGPPPKFMCDGSSPTLPKFRMAMEAPTDNLESRPGTCWKELWHWTSAPAHTTPSALQQQTGTVDAMML